MPIFPLIVNTNDFVAQALVARIYQISRLSRPSLMLAMVIGKIFFSILLHADIIVTLVDLVVSREIQVQPISSRRGLCSSHFCWLREVILMKRVREFFFFFFFKFTGMVYMLI